MPAQSICRHKTLHQYKPFLCFVTAIRTRISCFAPAQCRRRNTTALHAAHRFVFLLRENTNNHNRKHGKSFAYDVVHKTCAFFCFAVFAVAGKQTCGSHFSLPLVKRAEIKKGFPQGRKTLFCYVVFRNVRKNAIRIAFLVAMQIKLSRAAAKNYAMLFEMRRKTKRRQSGLR